LICTFDGILKEKQDQRKKKTHLRSEPNASQSHLHPKPHASLALQIIFHYEAPISSMPKWHDIVWQGN